MKAAAMVFVCALAGTARADEVDPYTKRVVIADVANIAAIAGGFELLSASGYYDKRSFPKVGAEGALGGTLIVAGTISYGVTPAILHARRKHPRGAMRSLVTRVGMPILAAFVGAAVADREGAEIGALVGAGGAIALDWFVFTRTF